MKDKNSRPKFLIYVLGARFFKQSLRSWEKSAGFTLIELLVVVAIVVIVSVAGFINVTNYRNKQILVNSANQVAAVLHDVQNRSVSQQSGLRWGIRLTNATSSSADTYQTFSGTSYATSSVDRTFYLSNGTQFGEPGNGFSVDEIFSPITGQLGVNKIISLVTGKEDGLVGDIILRSQGTITTRQENGLIGYWHLDEGVATTTYDASGMGNFGSASGTVWISGSNCKAGSCLSFNTPSFQRVLISTSTSLSSRATLTLSAWVYPTGNGGSDTMSTIIQGLSSPAYYLSFNDSVNALSCYWYGTTPAGYHTTSNNSVPLNQWSHLVCVWDGSNINQYINGLLASTTSVTGVGISPTLVVIGAETTARQFQGTIDEVRIYNRALTSTEILNLYNDLK
ncbi:MAG: LamG domain protein jellyroll fold domain protein [Candidatus Jorgensenbacteria bacterium GW2011_GWA1_48_11]|uniref:LamG domain protein jellyroll fold domain protein n=1 Tax=Candidatus Jorgensenbacteria bacterium GW2011_GWA1_48_11 TaxID=1618660 RepID=A0A0G1UBA3_9BACT|nr:MAG: LamG domain protein jellyroll fold domain protein [Candidatus Jorgensenbacteria bacterium GW2011_GWA1_48_11]KKW11894.1 MAG: LamG domain protein jellyroll fold domain protein [Candidatus Jorgensenbacteria bacterium GW2011_GWB1_49_9]